MNVTVRRFLATAAAATLLAFAGCGADGSGGQKASDEPASASSATADASKEAGQPLSAQEFTDVLETALDKATTAHVSVDLAAIGSGEGEADYTVSPPELAMRLAMPALGGGEVEVRLVDGTLYLKSAALGDKWVSSSLDGGPLGALGGQLDLTKLFETFAGAVTSATDQGADDVDGESLDHYMTEVDAKKLLDSVPGASAAGTQLPDSLTLDWWFDSDGLIRRFSGDFGGATVAVTLSDWGGDVVIEAPPSAEVTTMPERMAG